MKKIKTWFDKHFSKVKITDRTLWREYVSKVAFFSTLVTLISFFFTAKETAVGILGCIIIFLSVLIISFFFMYWRANHLKKAHLVINQTNVEIKCGNIFSALETENRTELSVIQVNEYFDDIVDNRIVSEETLHGKYIKKIINADKLTQLQKVIREDAFLNKTENFKDTKRSVGNCRKYKLGSVVEFESYILTALSKFNKDNEAIIDEKEYLDFLMTFWKNIGAVYSGKTLNIPLFGAGITRFKNGKPTKQQLLEIMIWTLKLSGFTNTYSDKAVRFIIYEGDMQEIDFYRIQHNLIFK